MFSFSDLSFELRRQPYCERSEFHFPNGYGISVIRGEMSYGGKHGFYELAVLDAESQICYTTSVTNDAMGWLTPKDVTHFGREVEALPEKG